MPRALRRNLTRSRSSSAEIASSPIVTVPRVGSASPASRPRSVDFPHPLIGGQSRSFSVTPESFESDLSEARTFGFVEEVDALRAAGLIKGASLENTVVLDDKRKYDAELVGTDPTTDIAEAEQCDADGS